jgi:hypothetical protein
MMTTRTKYNNRKTNVDGIVFDSKKEAQRYGELKMREMVGDIIDLKLQVPFGFTLPGDSKPVFKYIADFVYLDRTNGQFKIEDVKGFKTPLYKLKKKLIEKQFNIKIIEI